ncbi:hypothetical protein JHK82_051672 [Glycine max]|nr:hypothetical protein JHK82_051672 [Glycine max]
MFCTFIETSRHDHLKGNEAGSRRRCTAFTCSATGLNFFSRVLSLARVLERRS